jgi:phosphoserine phosphatase
MPKAAIFDLDGTLLDSVDLHALAWHEAMVEFGHDVSFEQARSQIGKGGDKLIPEFLSAEEQKDHGKQLEEWRGNRFKSQYLPLVRPFSAVPDLLRRVRDAGLRIAIGSSAKKDELDKYLEIARIADLVDVKTSSEDAGVRGRRDLARNVDGDDIGAVGGHLDRDGAPDAAGGAGDDGDLVLQHRAPSRADGSGAALRRRLGHRLAVEHLGSLIRADLSPSGAHRCGRARYGRSLQHPSPNLIRHFVLRMSREEQRRTSGKGVPSGRCLMPS